MLNPKCFSSDSVKYSKTVFTENVEKYRRTVQGE